jgi:hypothetical protein
MLYSLQRRTKYKAADNLTYLLGISDPGKVQPSFICNINGRHLLRSECVATDKNVSLQLCKGVSGDPTRVVNYFCAAPREDPQQAAPSAPSAMVQNTSVHPLFVPSAVNTRGLPVRTAAIAAVEANQRGAMSHHVAERAERREVARNFIQKEVPLKPNPRMGAPRADDSDPDAE